MICSAGVPMCEGTGLNVADGTSCGVGAFCGAGVCTAGKRVFVTSGVYSGNLGGLAGADAKCQALASAVPLSGTFKAWLSNATVSAASRLAHSVVPYVLVDGTIVADDWTGLTSGSLKHAIDRTQLNAPAAGGTATSCYFGGAGTFVWTNTSPSGSIANSNATNSCGNDWNSAGPSTSSGPFGVVGILGQTTGTWTLSCGSGRCETTAPLYCFEQ